MSSRLPPGPRFPPLQMVRFTKDATRFFEDCAKRCGDPFTMTLPLGTVVVTGSPQVTQQIFAADPNIFEPMAKVPMEPLIGENSLLLIGGDRHKRERRLIMPAFHGERMRTYGALMQEAALRQLEGKKPGATLTAQQITQAISMEVIIRAVFGVEGAARVERFRHVLEAYLENYTPSLAMMPVLRRQFGGMGPWARFQRHAVELDVMLTEEIAARRASGEKREDVLSMLLAAKDENGEPMTDVEVKDELRTMLVAGHETTAVSMTWGMYFLHRAPEALAKLRQELAAFPTAPDAETLSKLPYLSAVCDESLRLNPVFYLVSRKLREPFTLAGYELPAGTGLMVAITLTHSRPETFPEPERFQPERFLGRRYSPFEYVPFGGGARRCIGAAFALYEMKVTLGTLLWAHRFELVNDTEVRPIRRNVTAVPHEDIPLRYTGLAVPARVAAPAA
ncbi:MULTISPECIES: cytochrome P450 [Myxococcaceae]|uniref:CorO n=1 Tax=Corallococcus coralloides TaxID=184914 RepID=D7RK18_CORCK|nr:MULTISPECIES: cytochrome P450 [Myxococcaceae]ADI59538.1 CorO [Corallococcus coralloides]QAT84746.1 cytochrome P450 [Corallococcus coralloides]QPM79773.1 cytochrome P450 [Myxococcus xanthus]QVV57725.1 CorO [Vector pDPO-mxn116-Pvan-Tpase]